MTARYLILLFVVVVLAGATLWLAFAVAGSGMSPLFAAAGPVLLIAALAVRWRRTRR